MNYEEWQSGIADAERTINRADNAANTFAHALVGRLRKVDASTLAKLKRELKDFNPQRRTWKQ